MLVLLMECPVVGFDALSRTMGSLKEDQGDVRNVLVFVVPFVRQH